MECFHRDANVAYDIQGLSDSGCDVLLRLTTANSAAFVGVQVKSHRELSTTRDLVKDLRDQLSRAEDHYDPLLTWYAFLAADVSDQSSLTQASIRRIQAALSKKRTVTVVDPTYARTFLRLSKPQMDSLTTLTIRSGDPLLNLHLTQRSCDIALGIPYNIAGYSFLLELFSRFSGIRAGIFAHILVDAHIYTKKPDGSMAEYDHVPGLELQLTRKPRPLPRLRIDPSIRSLDDIKPLLEASTEEVMRHFVLQGYDPHPAITFKVAV